ncbi:MAG TPA: glycosyltransferase family 2 protein, partial [Gemmata sp.]|nr:glycosyltransferase family 2 protein [Gemmata sp.]
RVIVVDGGSTDRTVEVAKRFGADVLTTRQRGRGNQIAAGVANAHEEVILVAHADMHFPAEALARVRQHLKANPACPGGCLGHRFDSRRWIFRIIEWFDRRRAVRGMSYGDQAQFFRREVLARAGGFPAQMLMEDVELSRRLIGLGKPAYLDCPVLVSPRRFEKEGIIRTLWLNRRLRAAYRRGGVESCRSIYERYYESDVTGQ